MAESFSEKLIADAAQFDQIYLENGDPAALEDAIEALEQGCRDPAFLGEGEEDRARVLARLGIELIKRYLPNKNTDDLSAAFQAIRDAITQFAKNHSAGVELGNDIATRIRTEGPGNDDQGVVLQTVALYDELLSRADAGSELYLSLMGNKANAYRQLSGLSSDPRHVEESIATHDSLLNQVPSDSELRPGFLSNYGNALRQRFSMLGAAVDLSRAIEFQEQAVSSALDTKNKDLFQYTLGLSYLEKYALSRDEADLRHALKALQSSVELTPQGSFEIFPRMATLAAALRRLFSHTNQVSILEHAISLLDASLEATPEGSSDYPKMLGELSSALRMRHDSTGSVSDLQRSIEAQGRLVNALDAGSPDLPAQLADWAILLVKSCSFRPDLQLLYLAEGHLQKAILMAQDDDEFIARCYHNLANTQKTIFEAVGSREILEQAIRSRKEGIDLTPESSVELAARIAGLGQDEVDLYNLTKDSALLDSAVDRLRLASGMEFADEVDAAGVWYTLAQALARRHELTSSQQDMEEAKANLARALEVAEASSAPLYLTVASAWAYWAQSRQSWHEASVAFRHALDAADEIVDVQPTLLDRANRIERLEDLHVYASYSLFKDGEYVESVMALERGRARLLNQIRSVRSKELQKLAEKDPVLAEAATSAASRLDLIHRQEAESLAIQPISAMHDELKAAVQNWQSITSRIRRVDGFEQFGRGPNFDDVTALASIKPVVYVAPNYWGGLALIVTSSGELEHLSLPGLSTVRIHQFIEQMTRMVIRDGHPRGATDEICRWLWADAMGPIISALEVLGITEVFIVPIGILGVLPLHAAWVPDSSRKSGKLYALDSLTISYIPSAKSALGNLSATHLPFQSATIVEDPTSTLRYAPLESVYVLQHFPDARLIGGEAATKREVLRQLEGCNVLHFSCHGYSEPGDPMKSGLLMAFGETLTVSDIHKANLSHTRMVTLSACETGLISRRMMDEVLGFATAWMGLGVPCVLSAIWSVDDESTSHLMRLFYENLITSNMRPDQALRKAQIQIRDGAVPSSDFRHPFYWGAFFVTGY